MRKGIRVGLVGLMAATVLGTAPAAFASHGGGGVQKQGTCSMGSTWKVKASVDNSRLETEFEVDSNVVGQTWKVRLSDNGQVYFKGQRLTQAPSGSFEVRKFTADQAGSDTIKGEAINPATGETCSGSVTI
jgi:hypothetical protein